jgi:hypothetical protein
VVKIENILNKEEVLKQNPNLVFYDHVSLIDKNFQNKKHFIEWGEYKLYQEGNLYPKCNQFSLRFSEEGCWD